MLQEIRERAQGWVAWAIVVLISIPFALWGIQSYLGVGGEPVVAKVNGNEITERQFNQNVQRARMELRERLGAAYDPQLFGGQRLREQILDRMIREIALLDASVDMGLRVSDQAVRAAILAEPAFRNGGAFDKQTYERMLELQGLSPAAYEEQVRQSLLSTQLARAVADTEFVTPALIDASVRLLRQQRNITYLVLDQADFMPDAPPSDDEIQAFYNENQGMFQTPEQVRLSYLVLDAAELTKGGEATEEDLRARYEERLDEFKVPEERRVRHILLTIPADADDAAADAVKQRLLELRGRIEAGESFEDVAKAESEDPGSAARGGDLGMIGRGLMDPAFEQAAFSLEKDSLSEPVRSQFGYHLIEVTEIEGGGVKPFEEVSEQLAQEDSSSQSEAAFFDLAERLATLTYESPDSLVPAAEALGLEVKTSDWIDRSGGEGLLAHPKVTGAAFSQEVLDGANSELIEPERDVLQAIVLRVDEHRPPAVRPLDEVREDIVKRLQDRKAVEAALNEASALVERLRGTAKIEDVAGERELKRPGLVGRTAAEVPPAVLDLAFSMPRPGTGTNSYASGESEDGAVVVAVSEVVDGTLQGLDERESEQRMLQDTLAQNAFEHVLADIEARAEIERQPLPTDVE